MNKNNLKKQDGDREKCFIDVSNRFVPNILDALDKSTDIEDIRKYTDRLMAVIISSLGILAGILNLVLGLCFKDNIVEILIASFLLFLFSICLDQVVFKVKRKVLSIHLMSICTGGILLTVVFSYYDLIGLSIWTAIFVVLLLSIIRIDRIMYVIIGGIALGVNLYLFVFCFDQVIELNHLYYTIQMGLLITMLVIGFLWHRVYKNRFVKSFTQYKSEVRQKEEILQLYEEVAATEEELRIQNDRLRVYNSQIKANEEKLNFMAYNDPLTGLFNRKMIMEKIFLTISMFQESGSKFALVLLDFDGFKRINDSMGHYVGDQYLMEVGKGLSENIDDQDTVGRLGGDEFAIIIQHAYKENKLYEYIDKIRKILSEPYFIEGNKVSLSASFGISIFPVDGETAEDLFKTADAAMYKAKLNGKNNIQFFRKEMEEEILKKIKIESELLSALENGEFFLVYQPQVTIEKREILGFEALLRWQSPERGVVLPAIFIPILEEMGIIDEVGDWVLEQSCKKIVELRDKYESDFYVSVNVSPYQMKNNKFVRRVKDLIDIYNIEPNFLLLEITESIFIHDIDGAIRRINELKKIGVVIALDDFGTGYSSLSYLRRLPIDILKIDKSFIRDLEKGEKERKIVGSIINLVHQMDIFVLAEGVETDFQLDYLSEKACDHIQGYLISRPVSECGIDELINDK